MVPLIDLAPGAEENGLALYLADAIRENLRARPHKLSDFRALRGAVLVVPRDTGASLTMRFDHGRLTVHDGAIGIPTVTFCADAPVLERLAEVPLVRFLGLPIAADGPGRAALGDIARLMSSGDLRVYGLVAHPRMVLRFVRVVSRHG